MAKRDGKMIAIEKREATLYVYVKPKTKEFIEYVSEKEGLNQSEVVDYILGEYAKQYDSKPRKRK